MISRRVVSEALSRLTKSAAPVEVYTSKVLAHRDRVAIEGEKPSISFDQINGALEELGGVVKQFYSLRHPGNHLGNLTPISGMEFVTMFDRPWFTPGWIAPAPLDAASDGA